MEAVEVFDILLGTFRLVTKLVARAEQSGNLSDEQMTALRIEKANAVELLGSPAPPPPGV